MASSAEERIARLAVGFALEGSNELLTWLEHVTGEPVEEMEKGASWRTHGPNGMVIGLSRADPIAVAVQVGMAIAGMMWPFVFPGLLDEVKRLWREKTRAKKERA